MKAVNNSINEINKKLFKGIFFGILTGSLIITILMMLSSIIILQTGSLPGDILSYVVLVFIGIGSLLGGYIAGRIYKKNGLIIGAVTGVISFLILFLSGISNISEGVGIMTILKLVVTIIPSMLGAILGVNKKKKLSSNNKAGLQ